MRVFAMAFLMLTACDRNTGDRKAGPEAISFDGAQTTDAAQQIAHGERLTHVLGCTGCHGADLRGEQFEPEMKQYGPIYASNLTFAAHEFTAAQLDGIIRRGVHPTRRTVWVMPSEVFRYLSDADSQAVIAYLKSLKPAGRKMPPPRFSKLDREEIASGEYKSAAEYIREEKDGAVPVDLGETHALGRYITEVTCAECHGAKLEGEQPPKPGKPPDLIVAGGYSRTEFERLITQGVPIGNRKIREMMSGVAKTRFTHLTPHERDALYAYLKSRAEQP